LKVIKNIARKKSSSNPNCMNSYFKSNKEYSNSSKIIIRESNIPMIVNDEIKNTLTEELMKNDSIDVIQNKSYISYDRDNSNRETIYKRTNMSNTTLYLVNNFKEEKEMNQNNDIFLSQFTINNKTNFMNSFDLDNNDDENFSFDLINLYELEDLEQNNKNESYKINTIFDKRNDVSEINYDNSNIGYFTSNLVIEGKEFISSHDRLKHKSNCRVIDSKEEFENYIKRIIEFCLNTNEKNSKLGNPLNIFNCTVKTFKMDLLSNNEYNRIQFAKSQIFEIIDPDQFNIIVDNLFSEINEKTIDLSEHYKNSRRKTFDENFSKKNEYVALINEFMMKRANIFNEVCREFITKLNITKKLLFESFVFFIFKKNSMQQMNSNYIRNSEENIFICNDDNNNPNDSLIETMINSKKYEKYTKLFHNNGLFERLVIASIDEIIYKIIRLNYIGIKE